MHTNAFVLTMMVVELRKKFIKIILVGDPVVLQKNISTTLKKKKKTSDNFCFSGAIKLYMNMLIS